MHAKSQVMQFFTRNMHACNASDFNKESLASHVHSLHTQQIGLEYRGFPFELTWRILYTNQYYKDLLSYPSTINI